MGGTVSIETILPVYKRDFQLSNFESGMFRHRGKNRRFSHNVRLAAVLSFVAGIVNITGLLATSVMTTNVTGHFASFAEEFVRKNFAHALAFVTYIFCFLLGSFVSAVAVQLTERIRPERRHVVPILIEVACLTGVVLTGSRDVRTACVLLFAMGLQNALVTSVSNAVVRTTHLTGLFTDLGIELSRLFFAAFDRKRLIRSIELRLLIILCFFGGCVAGGYLFHLLDLSVLYVAAALLLLAMVYDVTRIRLQLLRRRIRHHASLTETR
jgi:uncharacterized membrane protein YoaK (UPF0700 family)